MLKIIQKIVHSISLNKVIMWVLTVFLALIFFTAYENRAHFAAWFNPHVVTNQVGLTFSISEDSGQLIKQQVISDRSIIGMAVMSTELRLNEAKSVFFTGDDPVLVRIFEDARRNSGGRVPLFTNLDESNADVVKLINGQFVCSKFTDTLLARLYPELLDIVKMTCRASIPAYYGYFSGYVDVFVNEPLSFERQAQLKLTIGKIATDIYFRDVIPTQHQERTGEKSPGLQ